VRGAPTFLRSDNGPACQARLTPYRCPAPRSRTTGLWRRTPAMLSPHPLELLRAGKGGTPTGPAVSRTEAGQPVDHPSDDAVRHSLVEGCSQVLVRDRVEPLAKSTSSTHCCLCRVMRLAKTCSASCAERTRGRPTASLGYRLSCTGRHRRLEPFHIAARSDQGPSVHLDANRGDRCAVGGALLGFGIARLIDPGLGTQVRVISLLIDKPGT
jgi:hypothetical protein